MNHIVILRFSAITETAIAAPLVRAYALANPDVKFTMVTIPFLKAFFEGIPNLGFYPIDITEEQEEKFKLGKVLLMANGIRSLHPTAIADLSCTKFSRMLCSIMKLRGVSVNTVKDIKKFSVRNSTVMSKFEKVLVSFDLPNLHFAERALEPHTKMRYTYHRIGIAPFAKYDGKSWPIKYMEEVVAELSKNPNNKIYLFGDKNHEAQILLGWEFKYQNCESIAGKYILKEELDLIRSLDLMITMDSANMHFASYAQTPVISIWGATDPSLGFYGFGQDPSFALCAKLDCRPCSLFGNAKCERDDYECLRMITPQMVLEKINTFFAN